MTSYRPRAGKRPSARQDAPGAAICSEVDREVVSFTEMFQWLQEALAQAGAIVSLETLTTWTAAQLDEARNWALEQRLTNIPADPSRHVSVRWPDHVSAAHLDGMKPFAAIEIPSEPEPEASRTPMKRPRRKAQAARVKQAADRKTRRQRK